MPPPDTEIELDWDAARVPFADAAAPAEDLPDACRRLNLLYEVGVALCRNTRADELLAEVPRAVTAIVGAQRCFVAVFDRYGVLRPRVSHGVTLPDAEDEWPVSRTIVRRVVERGVALMCPDTQRDGELSKVASIIRRGIRSILCVPLGRPKDACLGILYADSCATPGSFTLTDLKFATALSHFIHLGLRNARELERAQTDAALNKERSALLQHELLADHKIVGGSPALLAAYDMLKRAAEKEVPILLQGESGTGKELFARAVHNLSPRRRDPFVAISIAEINPNLIESELFGHEKGAFTGAFQRKIGKFELAQGGTLFLDELAEIPLHLQAKLLRVMETRAFERVGGQDPIEASFRLVCATHQSLDQMVQRGTFRSDLYYRLVGVQIRLPPLREHIEDIPDIAQHILRRLKSPKTFSAEAVRQLQRYTWPGNVRQLVRVVEAVDALCPRDEIRPEDLPPPLNPGGGEPAAAAADAFPTLADEVARVEREHIRRALALTQGNKEKARELLGVSKDTFWKRLKEFNLL